MPVQGPRLANAEKYAQFYAQKWGIPPSLFYQLIERESSWYQYASAKSPKCPTCTAAGLGQIIASTRKYLGITNPYDVDQSLNGAARYLREQYNTFGRWDLALAAYHRGPGAVKAAGNAIPSGGDALGTETRDYVNGILSRAKVALTGTPGGAGASVPGPPGSPGSSAPGGPPSFSIQGFKVNPGARIALIYGAALVVFVVVLSRLR